jgi:hypothetical protein
LPPTLHYLWSSVSVCLHPLNCIWIQYWNCSKVTPWRWIKYRMMRNGFGTTLRPRSMSDIYLPSVSYQSPCSYGIWKVV